ncbi:MAG TPA: hypothetical protein VEG38_18505 [Acidimicrobiia bacterium]|nr:hypothetical protein [Acidimicrobiia bacterium]
MDRTAELRWFFRQPPARALSDAFNAAGPPETRSDCYLVLPETDALGVKVRGGTTSLEFKLRAHPGRSIDLPSGASGQLEEWQKWSFGRSPLSRVAPRLGLPKHRWIEVVKHRRTLTVPYRDGSGCTVELTALEAPGTSSTTLGFEAFGTPADLVPALESATKVFFASVELPEAELSCGYPGWLATL